MFEKEVKYLIENYFKELLEENITLSWHNEKDSFAFTQGNPTLGFKISFSKKDYNKMKQDEILGVLSHELGHISYDKQKGLLKRIYSDFRIRIDANFLTKLERKVDKFIIIKGCGKYLLAFMKYHNRKYKKYNKSDGLTEKEIKKYIKFK